MEIKQRLKHQDDIINSLQAGLKHEKVKRHHTIKNLNKELDYVKLKLSQMPGNKTDNTEDSRTCITYVWTSPFTIVSCVFATMELLRFCFFACPCVHVLHGNSCA